MSDGDFDSWYALYPRKVGKVAARKAYTKARKDADHQTLMDGLSKAVSVWKAKGTDEQYIPYPATWLNAGRWSDEVATPDTRDRFSGMGLEL